MIEEALALLSGFTKAWNEWRADMRRKSDKDSGASEQREKTLTDENKTLADDRVRDSNDALQQRVRDNYGIEAGPDTQRILPEAPSAPPR